MQNVMTGKHGRIVVLHCKETARMAERLVGGQGSFELGAVSWGEFPDGTPDLHIQDVQQLHYRHVIFLACLKETKNWASQLALIYALPRYHVQSLTVVLPYFPTGTMERVDTEGQVATAMTLCRILSATPPTQSGPVRFLIYDIHALPTRFYFGDGVLPCLTSAVPLFLTEIGRHGGGFESEMVDGRVTIAFPDEGASKRFGPAFKGRFPLIVCAKVREGNKRTVRIAEGEPRGRHVIIVDDLVQSGGTLLQCQQLLQEHGAESVSCFVTHAVFPGGTWRKFLDVGLRKFFVTDSIPTVTEELDGQGPFRVLHIADDMLRSLLPFFTRSAELTSKL